MSTRSSAPKPRLKVDQEDDQSRRSRFDARKNQCQSIRLEAEPADRPQLETVEGGAPRAPPCCSEYLRASDAIARLVLCVLELLLALADLLLGFALLFAELVVGQLALGVLELALDLSRIPSTVTPFV